MEEKKYKFNKLFAVNGDVRKKHEIFEMFGLLAHEKYQKCDRTIVAKKITQLVSFKKNC